MKLMCLAMHEEVQRDGSKVVVGCWSRKVDQRKHAYVIKKDSTRDELQELMRKVCKSLDPENLKPSQQ